MSSGHTSSAATAAAAARESSASTDVIAEAAASDALDAVESSGPASLPADGARESYQVPGLAAAAETLHSAWQGFLYNLYMHPTPSHSRTRGRDQGANMCTNVHEYLPPLEAWLAWRMEVLVYEYGVERRADHVPGDAAGVPVVRAYQTTGSKKQVTEHAPVLSSTAPTMSGGDAAGV